MGEVVDRGPAHIHAHARGIDRREYPLLPCQRVVEPELHRVRLILRAPPVNVPKRSMRLAALLAGRPRISIERIDGRSQRRSLANNLPANAADVVKAVHGAAQWGSRLNASRGGPEKSAPKGPWGQPDRLQIGGKCGFHVLVTRGRS